MNKQHFISIIIPFYNRPELLNEVLEMIQRQTYNNFEVIIVDDASIKPLIVDCNYNLRVKLIRYETNKGPGYARRIGREKAEGNFICYLDSDDFWSENYLEACVKVLAENPKLGMVYSDTIILKEGKEIGRRVRQVVSENIVPDIFQLYNRAWSTSSCMWKSEISKAEHWFDLRNNEDYIHDIYSSKLNNKIKLVDKAFTFKNQSAENRILREGKEVEKAINTLIKINGLDSYKGISYFVLIRIYNFNIRVKISVLGKFLILPFKEFGIGVNLFYYYTVLFLNGIFNFKNYKIKSILVKLRPKTIK